MNNFNFMGFLIAHNRGKKLSKSDRNKNAFLSAFVPQDSFTGILTPMALADKEVAKLEKREVSDQLSVTSGHLGLSEDFILEIIQPDGSGDNSGVVAAYAAYILKIDPDVTAATLPQNPFFQKITDPAIRQAVEAEITGLSSFTNFRNLSISQTIASIQKSATEAAAVAKKAAKK